MAAEGGPRWSQDVGQADWIGARLSPWDEHVITMLIPAGFEAYARVLHPAAVPGDGELPAGQSPAGSDSRPAAEHPEDRGRLVRWADVAAWSGLPLRDDAQFHSVALPPHPVSGPPPFRGQCPREGSLWVPDAAALAAIACNWTTTPDECWFCVWDGFGWDSVVSFTSVSPAPGGWTDPSVRRPDPVPAAVRDGPRVRLPNRNYLLYSGPAAEVVAPARLDGTGDQCASLWWPADRAWCVATDIDLPWTYVGGPAAMIDAVLADRRIEAVRASPGDPVSRVEDWVAAWVDGLADHLLARGEASLVTSRGEVHATLRRPGKIRAGMLSITVAGTDGSTASGTSYLSPEDEAGLRRSVTFYLTHQVTGLAGM